MQSYSVIQDFNEVIMSLYEQGYDKNSELHRRLYRYIGYSLTGYRGNE